MTEVAPEEPCCGSGVRLIFGRHDALGVRLTNSSDLVDYRGAHDDHHRRPAHLRRRRGRGARARPRRRQLGRRRERRARRRRLLADLAGPPPADRRARRRRWSSPGPPTASASSTSPRCRARPSAPSPSSARCSCRCPGAGGGSTSPARPPARSTGGSTASPPTRSRACPTAYDGVVHAGRPRHRRQGPGDHGRRRRLARCGCAATRSTSAGHEDRMTTRRLTSADGLDVGRPRRGARRPRRASGTRAAPGSARCCPTARCCTTAAPTPSPTGSRRPGWRRGTAPR